MPKVISSSSSEDEADRPTPETPTKQKETVKKTTKYQCPADFVSFCHAPCSSTLTDSLKSSNNELWLIKAPASFSPECFSGIKVPLSGLQTLKVPAAGGVKTASGQQIYSILASTHGTSELHLLTSDKQSSDSMRFAPAFSGLLNVCESYGDSSTNQSPQVIPAAPPPSIPPGLKQRFHPFGSKTPTLTVEDEADGVTFRPSTLKRPIEEKEEEEEEEGRKKKKKKKKEKRIKTELEEEVVKVKEEPAAEDEEEAPSIQEGEYSEKRKKKKKKKDKEREEVEEEEVTVKCEPMDTSYDDAEGSGKKKKKKKDKQREEVEEEEVTVKREPAGFSYNDAVAEGSGKKKKKKKSKSGDD
ncbi:CD3e molecule, epsilon associated protein [Acanthochromis polyacanthus]|uniref:DNA-directed RNA polymerase I subunit RPA34-like n=1 Tax=Acanthochromis polyacanthus TaxID=80966 RepID=A0A3Q1ELH6_9TELE|nr:CD3e molecule, epsilon associated protein [Acanthochromis polyacanthus]